MPNIYRLTAQDSLDSRLELFLISCKVEGLSEATIHDYKVKIGRFVNFSTQAGFLDPKAVDKPTINLFLLELRETNQPLSVLGYFKSIK